MLVKHELDNRYEGEVSMDLISIAHYARLVVYSFLWLIDLSFDQLLQLKVPLYFFTAKASPDMHPLPSPPLSPS